MTQVMWVIFDFHLKNYMAFTFDILTILSNLAGIARLTYAKAK
ncbi:MAG: YgjV family protein [Clostridia bacterium]|nr:YgjV family protein [Clostridia bacterium]